MECYLHTNSIKIILRRCIIFIRFIVQLIISASPHCMFDFNIFTRNWSPTIRFDYSCRCMWNRKYTYIPILYANDRIDISHRELKSDILSHIESIPIGIILGWFCVTHSKCDPCRFVRSHGLFYHLDIMPYAYWIRNNWWNVNCDRVGFENQKLSQRKSAQWCDGGISHS